MFRHQGRHRTLKHNLQIATILAFVAGIVNVTGYLYFKQLTKNVTGHFALFIYDVITVEIWKGTIYFMYIFSFLVGSFFSSYLIEKFKQSKKLNIYVVPTLLECLILLSIGVASNFVVFVYADIIVCLLLFAMGVQNSFVTKISNAVVRTTHLTGLFTDLGIDLSQLLFPISYPDRSKIKSTIKLRIYIIGFFFLGGIVGGFLYYKLNLKLNTLILAAIILLISLLYDDIRFRWINMLRRSNHHMSISKQCK